MPDAQTPAAAAPAQSAAPTAPAAAPAGDQKAAAPAPKLKGRAAHDAIRAKLSASKAAAPASTTETPPAGDKPTAAAPAKTDSATPAPTEPEEKKPAVGAVMRLTAENTKLKGQLEELQGKLTASSKDESVATLRERVKKDPAVLFDVFGEDIDADGDKRWERLVDAIRDRSDPATAADRERDKEIAALKQKLADADKTQADNAEKDRAAKRRAHTAQILTEGFKDDIGEVIVDASKYPYVNHLTKTGEVDAHAGISAAVKDLVGEFIKKQGKNPTDGELAKMIAITAEESETYFAKRAKNWQPPAAPAPAAAAPPTETRERPTTIGSGLGGRDSGGVDTSKLSPREKHALIRERLRTANRQAAN